MAKLKSNDFLLYMTDTPTGTVYERVAALTTNDLEYTREVQDITSKDSDGWMESFKTTKSLTTNGTCILSTGSTSQTNLLTKSFFGASATGTLTFSVNPTNGQTIVLNGVTITFRTTAVIDTDITIGGSLLVTLASLSNALNARQIFGIDTADYMNSATVLSIVAKIGATGNAYTLNAGTTTATASGATLTGGVDDAPTWKFRITRGAVEKYEGVFVIDSLKRSGDVNGVQTFEIALSNSGTLTYTPAP